MTPVACFSCYPSIPRTRGYSGQRYGLHSSGGRKAKFRCREREGSMEELRSREKLRDGEESVGEQRNQEDQRTPDR